VFKTRLFIALAAVVILAGCASPTQGNRPSGKVAYITSGETYFYGATRYGQSMAVLEIDGKPVTTPADPLELQPGRHVLKMRCGDSVSNHTLDARAGDIFQYAMRPASGGKGCVATLERVRGSF